MAASRFGSLPGMATNMPVIQQQIMVQRPQRLSQGLYQVRPAGNVPSISMASQPNRMAGHPYASAGTAASPMDSHRKRPDSKSRRVKKRKAGDKVLPQRVRELVPESQAYMDLLAFERKLDSTIMRKRLDIQEALKRPVKQKRKLRVFLTTHFYSPRPDAEDEDSIVPSWELRVEGKLMDDQGLKPDVVKQKRKFSSFFRSLVIELDKDIYGPDNHLVEWHRTDKTQETDGFQVKRPGEDKVKCTIMLLLDYQPAQYKLDPRLARLLGIHTQTRPVIINALWQYIKLLKMRLPWADNDKTMNLLQALPPLPRPSPLTRVFALLLPQTHGLQDASEREFINNDEYFEQIFECPRMRFNEIPQRLSALLYPPDPIVIKHIISKGEKKTTCYDIDVEVDDTLKAQMQSFLLSTASQQEITTLDTKIHETVETINQLKVSREFFLGFAQGPQAFINQWITSQNRDLKIMTDVVGNPEEERHADFYYLPWSQEAVCRYFYNKVQQKRAELEQALGIRNT